MITAELQHRDYLGYKEIATQFSSLSFYGNPSVIQPLNELSGLMEDSQKIKNNVKIKCLNAKKDDNIAKITLLSGQLRDLKKRLLTNLLVKDARIRINQIKDEIQRLEEMNEEIISLIKEIESPYNQYNSAYFYVQKLNKAFNNILSELGFSLTSSHHNEKTHIEHESYEYTGIDQKLFAIAYKKLEIYKENLQAKCESIEFEFTKQLLKDELPLVKNTSYLKLNNN